MDKSGEHKPNVLTRIACLLFFQFLSICKKGVSAPVSAVAGILLILVILALMLVLLYCFNHEERLMALFQRHVVDRFFERRKAKFRFQHSLKRMVAWLTMVERYREGAEPKQKTITIRFENLSLVLKKVKYWVCVCVCVGGGSATDKGRYLHQGSPRTLLEGAGFVGNVSHLCQLHSQTFSVLLTPRLLTISGV